MAIVTVGVVVLGVAGLVTWLAARGIDPGPVIELTAKIATAAGSLGTLALQLVSRRTVAKTERNTGLLTNAVLDIHDALPVTVPPPARHGTAPAADGE